MKKKFLFGLGALVLAAVLALNVTLVKDGQNFKLSLNALEKLAKAGDEGTATVPCFDDPIEGGEFYGRICLDENDHVICTRRNHPLAFPPEGTCTITN